MDGTRSSGVGTGAPTLARAAIGLRNALQRLTSASAVLLLAAAGRPALVHAQVDLSGEWSAVAGRQTADNPQIGEYVGLPLSAGALRRAETWDPEIESLPMWQCRPPSASAARLGALTLRIGTRADPATGDLTAIRVAASRSPDLLIYMDGRGHPAERAGHTWTGFATGEWVGDILKVRTTHLKEGYYRRNGVPQSDRARFTDFLMRRTFRGRDYLSWVVIAQDPVFLTEPLLRSGDYRLEATSTSTQSAAPCAVVKPANGTSRAVPSFFPGANELLDVFAESHDLPPRVSSDGALTMYPEYRAVIDAWRPVTRR